MQDDERAGPWDPGLQVERTTLAWLRTGLTFIVGVLVVIRLVAHESTLLAAAFAVVSLPLAAAVVVISWRRHRQSERSLRAEAPLPDSVLPAAVAILAVLAGCIGLAYVVIV